MKEFALLAALVAVVGCSSGHTATTNMFAFTSSPPLVTDSPTSSPEATPTPVTSLVAGGGAPYVGDLTISVGKPLGVAEHPAGNFWIGFPVTVSGGDVSTFSATDLLLGPVSSGDMGSSNNFSSGTSSGLVDTDNITPIACKGMALMPDTLGSTGLQQAQGCVYFGYSAGDHPTTISYFLDSTNTTVPALATWTFTNASKPIAAPTGIVYTVTSDGGISNVTYSTAGFGQEQDTNVQGNTWSKKIPDDGVSTATVLSQSAGDGTITCTITIDGKQVAKQSSHGAYAIATCTAETS